MTQRIETKYFKPVGIKDGSIYFLDYTFDNGDFKGATGTILDPISKDYIADLTSEDWIDYCRDIWVDAVQSGSTEESLEEFSESVQDEHQSYGRLFPGHDDSYSELYEEAHKHFDNSVETFNCSGGGRCFDEELLNSFDKVINPELIKIIKKFESIKQAA